uniref:Eukaryotic translation initiation factor 4E n=1 Tax=Alexandrium catenella TaxID=2925 RepID=A0A7S1SFV6_ALECA
MAQQQQYLSFNNKISPTLAQCSSPNPAELEEMKAKDPALRYTWTIWEQIMQATDSKTAQYSDTTHRVASFSTVKGFWKYWNHLPQPSELLDGKKFVREGADSARNVVDALMVFRDGIKPEWEDAINSSGGHFQFQLKVSLGGGTVDEYWNNIVLGMIGGTIEPAEMITGIRLVDKLAQARSASIRIEVWFSNFDDSDKVDLLQRNLEKCMTTRLDGTQSSPTAWGRTDRKPHSSSKK